MKSTFIHIDTAVMIGQLHLKGYELLVYALVSGLSKGGSEWVKKPLQWYADTLGTDSGRVSVALNLLVKKGLLEMSRNSHSKYYKITLENPKLKLGETPTQTLENPKLKLGETPTQTLENPKLKLGETPTQTLENPKLKLGETPTYTLYNNNNNNRGNNARARGETPAQEKKINPSETTENYDQPHQPQQPESPSPLPPSPDDRTAVAEAWADHYKLTTGTNYEIVNFSNTTEDINTLAAVIRRKAATFGIQPDQHVKDFAHDLFDHFRSVADQWQLSHWTTHTVTTQFNELYDKTLNNGTKPQSTNKDPNCRISSDYIERTMREAGIDL